MFCAHESDKHEVVWKEQKLQCTMSVFIFFPVCIESQTSKVPVAVFFIRFRLNKFLKVSAPVSDYVPLLPN